MEFLSYPLGFLMGFVLGILGGGGSLLAIPIFVYVLGYGPKESIAMSLGVVGTVALTGAYSHWRNGNMNLRIAVLFGGVAMVGSYAGARVATLVPGAVQLAVFGVVTLAASIFMFRDDSEPTQGEPRAPLRPALVLGAGVGVGLVTGFVGVGGGFLIVPALVLFTPVGMKRAVGISLLVIAMTAGSGFVGYLDQVRLDAGSLIAFTACAIAGIVAGSKIVQSLPQDKLKRIFAVFLVVVGVVIVVQNGAALL